MNNRMEVMRQIELAPVTIFTYKFLAPLARRDYQNFISQIERLAEMFYLDHDGADYLRDTMHRGRLYSEWFIIVKGSENGVEGFEREARRLMD